MSLISRLEQTNGKRFLHSLAYIFHEGHEDLNKFKKKKTSEKCALNFGVESHLISDGIYTFKQSVRFL